MRRVLILLLCLWVAPAWSQAIQYQTQLGQPGTTPVSPTSALPTTTSSASGVVQGVSAAGNASRVAQEPTQMFWDDFGTGTLDTTAKWSSPTTGGGGNATAANNQVGATTLGSGTTASGWSILSSQFSFPGKNPSWNFFQEQNNFEFPVLTNAVRFWGFATFPAAPTAAKPYADAVGFELGTDGHLRAVTSASAGSLAAGTETIIADLSQACTSTLPYGGALGTGTSMSGCSVNLLGKVNQPQDNGVHKYIIYFRGDNIYWAIDGIDNIVAFTITGAPGPNANTLPVGHIAVANTPTGPSSSATITVNQTTVGDTGRNEIRICDPTNPWRCAAVSSAGALSTSASLTGSTSNASDGVATSSTNVPTVSYNYLWNGTTWDRLPGTVANGSFMQGAVASGSADSGNPVKIGGRYNSAKPTLTNGQRGDLQLGTSGSAIIQFAIPDSSTAVPTFNNPADNNNPGNSYGFFGFGFLNNGSNNWDRARDITGAVAAGTGDTAVAIAPTSAAASGITSVVSASAENNHVLKASAGNLYSVYATNLTATGGFLVVLNSTTAPGDGAITPLECVPLPANGNASVNYNPGPAAVFSTGITAVLTSATTCFTKTTGTITGFIKGSIQ